jgi:hypothetical protein
MDVAGPQTRTEEEAFVDAGHHRMIAAHAVVSIVGAAGLVAVDDLGEGIEIDGGLLARKSEEGAHDRAQDVCEARPVLVTGKRVLQPRQRGLRAQALGKAGIGGAQRAVASPLGDREPQGWIGVQQRDVVLVAPPLDQGEESRAYQLEEGVHDLVGVARIIQMLRDQTGQAQLLAQLAHQQHPGVGRHAIGTRLDHDRTIALQRKQRTLNFTHGVSRRLRDEGAFSQPHLIAVQADTPWVFYITTVTPLAQS